MSNLFVTPYSFLPGASAHAAQPRRVFRWLLAALLLAASTPVLAQTCLSESEIPSTTPSSDFTDHGDGTVTHHKTGLMWMKCPLGQSGVDCTTGSATAYTWQGALQTTDGYSFAGYTDWRLPNIKELRSIVENRCYDPAINASIFPSTPSSHFWSAGPYALGSSGAWYVHFGYGGAYGSGRDSSYRVRLVRSGQ